MKIHYKKKKLEKIINDKRLLKKHFGILYRHIPDIITYFHLAKNLHEIKSIHHLKLHNLKFNRKGELAVTIIGPWRIVFKAGKKDVNLYVNVDDDDALKKITEITIIEIVDYH